MKHVCYRSDIDALRGLAVALVVIYHAFPSMLPGGFIGVDVFFVISGYLITLIILKSLQKKDFSLRVFYSRRIRRLFPSLITVLAFVLVIGWLILYPSEYKQLGNHVSKSVVFILNYTLMGEVGYFDVESHYKPLLHLWTLSVEEQYYLFWPLILLLLIRLGLKPLYVFAMVFVISLVANIYLFQLDPGAAYYNTFSRVWQLASGSLLAAILINKPLKANRVMFFSGIAVIVMSAVTINGEMSYPGFLMIFPVAGAVMVIFANVQLPVYMGFLKLGIISYPLYLWHWVLLSFIYIYLGKDPDYGVLILVLVISIFFSYFTYRYIERLRYIETATPYMIFVLILIGLAGVYIDKTNGLPERSQMKYFMESGLQFKRTPARDESCVKYVNSILNKDPDFNYCRTKNIDSERLIAVIGDSHAHAVFPGVAGIARKNGYGTVLMANSSCPPLKGFMWGTKDKQVEECQVKIGQIIKILEKDKRIARVIFLTRGPVYIHGEVKGNFTEDSVARSLEKIKQKSLTYDSYFRGFRRTVAELSYIPHITNIYYMFENPELDFIPKEVIPRPFDFFGISTNRSYVERSLYVKRMFLYREGFKKIKYNKLVYLDPANKMCSNTKCYSFINSNFLYADDDHFSIYGARFIMEGFEKKIFEH